MKIQGYYLFHDCITDPTLLSELSQAIDSAIASDAVERSRRGMEQYRFYDIVHLLLGRGACFIRLLDELPVLAYTDGIVGSTSVIHSYNAVRLMPHRGNNATKVHRDSPRFSPGYVLSVQALVFVDDFTVENGATWLLPGSHNAAERPADAQFYERAIQVPGTKGSVLVFDSSVWHAGGENRSEQPRRGITFVFTRAFMKQQIDLPRATSPAIIAGLSERSKRLIGMNVRVPSSLDEFLLPEDQRLYRAGQG